MKDSLNQIIKRSISENWNLDSLTDLGGTVNYRYADVAENIEKIHILFDAAGIKTGDKIAICGKNSSDWMVVFLSCLTYGAVAVPILHEFSPESITNLVNHSEARILFADKAIYDKLDPEAFPSLVAAIYISEQGLAFSNNQNLNEARKRLNELFGDKFPEKFSPDKIRYFEDEKDNLALINYTSGSTGSPKGVMLSYGSILSNIVYCIEHLTFLKPGDGMVNMLPLGHMYGMVIESLHPFVKGCHCNFILKPPSPAILLNAFAKVRPKLIITVPLVLEKIIRNKVFPLIEKPVMKIMLALPYIKQVMYGKIRSKLIDVFGGNLHEIIIGGAPLNPDVESFLYTIKFPVTVGYGMTECGPLLTYCPSGYSRPHTVGRQVDRMELKIVPDDETGTLGNIFVKGDNVMLGYYKNPEATKEVFPMNDGWMDTGDRGRLSPDGMLTISGRSKTMILGPSGQNIYPEEIEQKINNLPYVEESLVIDDNGKLKALVFPNYENASKDGLDKNQLDKLIKQNIDNLNKSLEPFSRVSSHSLMEKEFEKTPKKSIKRFLYQP